MSVYFVMKAQVKRKKEHFHFKDQADWSRVEVKMNFIWLNLF